MADLETALAKQLKKVKEGRADEVRVGEGERDRGEGEGLTWPLRAPLRAPLPGPYLPLTCR